MQTPKHLEGLISVIAAVEAACDGTDYEWLVRRDRSHGYYAAIYSVRGADHNFIHFGSTPASALANALTAFNLRTHK